MREWDERVGSSVKRRDIFKNIFLDVLETPLERRADFVSTLKDLTADERLELNRLLAFEPGGQIFLNELRESIGSAVCDHAFFPGDLIAQRFRILRFLARGGMGEVYEADDLELDERVALKFLRSDLSTNENFISRFREEIRLSRGITNPHVCRVHDLHRHVMADGSQAVLFAMEMLKGETLRAFLARHGALPIATVRKIAREMVDGLTAAHASGVLHRDFKTSNVMLSGDLGDPRVVITDFGIARPLHLPGDDLRERIVTPAYAAPEQLEGGLESQAVDVFSLGVVLYEMLTGRLPFIGADREVTPIPLNIKLERRWEGAIFKALAKNPGDRFASINEMGRALGFQDSAPPLKIGRRTLLLAGMSVTACTLAGWRLWRKEIVLDLPTVAVMPLDLESGATAADTQVAGGVIDRFTDLLARIPELRVISRSASQRALRDSHDIFSAASKLGAGQVISGRLTLQKNQARIRFELAQVGSRSVLWSQTSDIEFGELEAAYRQAVVGVIGVLKLQGSAASSGLPLTRDNRAYERYLKARFIMELRQFAPSELALQLIDEALGFDPQFGKAWALRGVILEFLSARDGANRGVMLAKAKQCAHDALRLEPDCAEAFSLLAAIQQYWDWDRAGAEISFKRAIEAGARVARVHHAYAKFLYSMERHPESLNQIELATSLDPLSPTIRVARGYVLLYSGKVMEAIAQLRAVVASEPGRSTGYIPLADGYEANGQISDAIQAAQAGVNFSKRASFALSQLGHAFALAGRHSEAKPILTELEQRYLAGKAKANEVAAIHAGWRDSVQTLSWLERGLPSRDVELSVLRVSVAYKFLRGEAGFDRLLKRVSLI